MKIPLTKELLVYLQSDGYTYLVAEGQASQDWYVFTPVRWDEEAFFNECLHTDFSEHMILSVNEALSSFVYEDYLNHEVVLK